ncbi:MAG TPA: patatin-like phospholipase family protein [Puia sp.]|nr:patatin-like phospholipase family protein [Puia sp.]
MQYRPFVLSGGGCRGAAHLGAIKAFHDQNIYPSEIAGTSAGALAGVFLANGFTPDEIKEMFMTALKPHLPAWTGLKIGSTAMENLRIFLKKNLRYKSFEELTIPFYVTATNFIDGRQVIFNRGEIIDKVIAACSIPIIFPLVLIDNIPYVDGGISNNLPVEPFIGRLKEVVSIYVNPLKLFSAHVNTVDIMDRTLHLIHREMIERSAAGCFAYIEPPELHSIGLFDIRKIPDAFDIAYRYTKEVLI